MKSYSFGTTPKKVILAALKSELGNKPYHISAVLPDATLIKKIVNIGIDSCLEAMTESKFDWTGSRLECYISHKDMLVFLRRLYENGSEEAWSWRSDILSTLEIEEI
jgi:hypothetical protein